MRRLLRNMNTDAIYIETKTDRISPKETRKIKNPVNFAVKAIVVVIGHVVSATLKLRQRYLSSVIDVLIIENVSRQTFMTKKTSYIVNMSLYFGAKYIFNESMLRSNLPVFLMEYKENTAVSKAFF